MTSIDNGLLVAPDGSRVDRRAVASREVYDAELRDIFAQCWLVVGHESQIPEADDFITSTMGEESVIVARRRDGTISVTQNRCSHRGVRVCRVDQGSAAHFTCPNHGWRFSNDGRLVSVPQVTLGYGKEMLGRPDMAMIPARVELLYGFIFATFGADAPPLAEYLGDATYYLDAVFGRYEHGIEVLGGVQKSRIASNWKFASENLGTDLQHPEVAHASFMEVTGDGVMGYLTDVEQVETSCGHPLSIGRRRTPIADPHLVLPMVNDPAERLEVEAWFEESNAYAETMLGHTRANLYVSNGSIFPNMSFLPGLSAVYTCHPRGPGAMEWWSYCVVPVGAPPAVRAARRAFFMLGSGPGGIILAEDLEMWADMTTAAMGTVGADRPLPIDRGMGEEYTDPVLPGVFSGMRSEHSMRAFWRRWRRAMGGSG